MFCLHIKTKFKKSNDYDNNDDYYYDDCYDDDGSVNLVSL